MEKITLKKLLFFSFLSIVAIMGLGAYLASLVIPDTQFFIDYPFWHSFAAWLAFGIIAGLTIVVLYFIVDLAIDKEVLQKEKDKLEKENTAYERRVREYEAELNRLRNR